MNDSNPASHIALAGRRASRFAALASIATMLTTAAAPAAAVDRALLIGVSVYPHLPGRQLVGPANDVRLMQNTVTRLGVAPARVKTLSEAAGSAAWPTRANILTALARLAEQSRPGDWAIVYFSGHGSQVPQTAETRARYAEPDGFDEVFLPRDTARWDARRQVVTGAITDDEIGIALRRVADRGARVWAIFDTCHAGDMTRGAATMMVDLDERPVWRHVPPTALGVPAALLMSGEPGLTRGGKAAARGPGAAARRETPWVAFFAAQSDEGAAEEVFPDPDAPALRTRFGVFTYHLHRAIEHWSGSFSTLTQAVDHAYRDRPFPTPQYEGPLETLPAFSAAVTPRATRSPPSSAVLAKPDEGDE